MGARREVAEGERFGRLTVVRETEAVYWRKYRKRRALCLCACGRETIVYLTNLRSGHTTSCGGSRENDCARRRTHGMTGTRLHGIWGGMLSRCRNPRVKSYQHYGARGIRVCGEWHDFAVFHAWAMANGYQSGLTIERVDNDGNYEPINCTWIPKSEQSKNRRCCLGRS